MPIEIRELNIKVSISQNQQEEGKESIGGSGGDTAPDKDMLISECVEQVMELIKMQKER